jgi:hypothetical protein
MDRVDKHTRRFPDPDGEPKNIWEEFGLPRPEYEDERFAPPVDREALQALVDQKLPGEEARELYRLTLRFRSWADALAELSLNAIEEDLKDPNGSWG